MTSFQTKSETLLAPFRRDGDELHVQAPAPGIFRLAQGEGSLIRPGCRLGTLTILGRRFYVLAKPGCFGAVSKSELSLGGTSAVEHGQSLLVLRPEVQGTPKVSHEVAEQAPKDVFVAASSGRFYSRPSPDRAPFVSPGDVLEKGTVVGLLEVMKTFSRITFSAEDVSSSTSLRVKKVVPDDGDDLEVGDVIIEFDSE